MGGKANRTTGLLTDTHRDILSGEYEGKQESENRRRREMPDRIRHSVLDFALLAKGLPDEKRQEIFSPSEYPLGESDGHLYGEDEHFTEFVRNYPDDEVGSPSEGYIHRHSGVKTESLEHLDIVEGLHTALAFIYRAADDAGIPFDSFLETAIRRAFDKRYEVHVETSRKLLPPEPDSDPDVKDIEQKIQNEENTDPLTDAELRVMLTESGWTPEAVAEAYERQKAAETEPETVEFTENDLAEAADALRGFHEMKEIRRKRNQAIKAANAYVDDGGDVDEPLRALKSWILNRDNETEDADEANRISDALDHLEAYGDAGGTMEDSLADMAEWEPEQADDQRGSEIEES